MLLLLLLFIVVMSFVSSNSYYNKSDYHEQTGKSLSQVYNDKGSLGEYYIYECLNDIEGTSYFLFNVYIPKNSGVTEIDVILLHTSGIYVFESKNYGGWIFGSENQTSWTQTLPTNKGIKKTHFFNPVIQNKNHIKWLKAFIKDENIPIYSYVVFSDRCTLKSINLVNNDHRVIKRCDLLYCIESNIKNSTTKLSDEHLQKLYNILYSYTQVSDEQKQCHIESIHKKYR